MADHWLGISSAEYDSHCGDSVLYTLERALDGISEWWHQVDEIHWFILDLGQTYTIKKFRGRSGGEEDPIDVDIYVSDDKENWGDAVATGIDVWQDDFENWTEVDSINKNGRYIKVVINATEEIGNFLIWVAYDVALEEYLPIFDAYGDVAAPPVSAWIMKPGHLTWS